MYIRLPFALLLTATIVGCSATTQITSNTPSAEIAINTDQPFAASSPVSRTYPTTSFGQYRFAARAEGHEPFFGLMPLKFNGGYLAADILFFAPATFFNLREVFPFYEVDMEKREVRYRKRSSDDWTAYRPTSEEMARAEAYFAGAGR